MESTDEGRSRHRRGQALSLRKQQNRGAAQPASSCNSGEFRVCVVRQLSEAQYCKARIILQRRGAAQPASACACCGILHTHLSRARTRYVGRARVAGSGQRSRKRNDDDNANDDDSDVADDADDDDNRRSIGILLSHHRPPQEPAPSCHGKLGLGTVPLVLGVALEYVHTRHGGQALSLIHI